MQPQPQLTYINNQTKPKGAIAILGIIVLIAGCLMLMIILANYIDSSDYWSQVNPLELAKWILYDMSICTAIIITGFALIKIDERLADRK